MHLKCLAALWGAAVLGLIWNVAAPVQADVKLAPVFTDNMVIQVDRTVCFFGTADPGERVSVTLKNDIIASTKANADGRWLIKMNPLKPGAPFEVVVEGKNKITLRNVVVGEVWICGGQSNMEWPVRLAGDPKNEIANAKFPLIRHIKIEHRISPQIQQDVVTRGSWTVCSPETAANYTAVGYYFARKIHQETGLPVGLIDCNWGGTIVEAWISGQSLKTHPDFKQRVEQIEANAEELIARSAEKSQELRKWNQAYRAALRKVDPWQSQEIKEGSDWQSIHAGQAWESQGKGDVDGVAWYRKRVKLPSEMQGKDLKLSLGMIDDNDITWVNGTKIGSTNGWNKKRQYTVPAALTSGNELTIAVRVVDTQMGGGMVGSEKDYFLALKDSSGTPKPISVAKDWKFRFSTATAALGPRPKGNLFAGPNNPTALFNAMLHPIIATSFRGAIWYQGESNAGRGKQYRTLFPLLIEDWRAWHAARRGEVRRYEFPFYWVQLANWRKAAVQPGPSSWAELREAQTMTLATENTGQAIAVDIGDANDIHPKNKQEVGRRLALLALANVYGKTVPCRSPLYADFKIEDNRIRVDFKHAEGLMAKGGELKRFEIAGADKKFVWANAKIDGESVVVSSEQVPQPKHVRYAWADNPDGCNLYNGAGLPASPFRTDQD